MKMAVSLTYCVMMLLMLTVTQTHGASHRAKRLADVVCDAGTTKIIPPRYYKLNSPGWCDTAVGLLNNDFKNMTYRLECQRWLGGALPDQVAQVQLNYCWENTDGSIEYHMGLCCQGTTTDVRCFTGSGSRDSSTNYNINYQNQLTSCLAGEVCQTTITFYGSDSSISSVMLSKGCAKAADCAAASNQSTESCKDCAVATPICTTCCTTQFCNYDIDLNSQYRPITDCPKYPCNDGPCQNGAICENTEYISDKAGYANYTCWCTIYWGGRKCTVIRTLCTFANPCLNGGTCWDRSDVAQGEFRCDCPQPFVGDRCELRSNLTCSVSDSNYRTVLTSVYWAQNNCTPRAWSVRGYPEYVVDGNQLIQRLCADDGRTAAYRIEFELMSCTRGNHPSYHWDSYHSCCYNRTPCNVAINPCLNGGTCFDYNDVAPGEYRCECPSPYIGDNCEFTNHLTCSITSQFYEMRPPVWYGYDNPRANCSTWVGTARGHPELSWPTYIPDIVNYDCINSVRRPSGGHQFVQGVDGQIRSDRFQFEATYCGRNDHLTFVKHHVCCPTCLSSPCQNDGYCQQLTYNSFVCKCPFGYNGKYCENKLTVCVITGDPHIRTFDGKTFDYQGTCKQTLAAPCNATMNPYFDVAVKSENRDGISSNVSLPSYVEIRYLNDTIGIYRSPPLLDISVIPAIVMVNGLVVDLRYVTPTYFVDYDGLTIRFEATLGLTVTFEGNYTIFVYIPTTMYQGQMCGLCGNNDNIPSNDMTLANGTYVGQLVNAGNLVGDSYVIPDPQRLSSTVCTAPLSSPFFYTPVPLSGRRKRRDVNPMACSYDMTACQLMNSTSGVFGFCIGKIGMPMATFFAESCIMDACFTGSSSVCSSVKTFVDMCIFIGAQIPCTVWQDATGCSGASYCPAGMIYKCSTKACLATCADPEAPDVCPFANKDACVCPPGELLYNGTCTASCPVGCLDQHGQLQLPGDMYAGPGCTTIRCHECANCTVPTYTNSTAGCPPGMMCTDGDACTLIPPTTDDDKGNNRNKWTTKKDIPNPTKKPVPTTTTTTKKPQPTTRTTTTTTTTTTTPTPPRCTNPPANMAAKCRAVVQVPDDAQLFRRCTEPKFYASNSASCIKENQLHQLKLQCAPYCVT